MSRVKTIRPGRWLAVAATVGMLGVAGTAEGLPWDVDMADGQAKKAYSHVMEAPVEGTVSQASLVTPIGPGRALDGNVVMNHVRGSKQGQALTNPYESNLPTGEYMYNVYCTPCHADGAGLGKVAELGYPGVQMLSGPAGVVKSRVDGWLYLTIRNGGGLMPSYGWAMSDNEMWSVVEYLRTLPESQYVPPTPLSSL